MNCNIDKVEMFRVGCGFSDCADFCLKEPAHPQLVLYITPAVVNAAFACEVFLKLLLQINQIALKKEHQLKELFEKLPFDIKQEIKERTICKYGKWEDIWNQELVSQISNVFIDWRYIYENDWGSNSVKEIEIGFLFAFRDSLKEVCTKKME